MGKGVDALLRFVATEVALQSEAGASIDEFIAAVANFESAREDKLSNGTNTRSDSESKTTKGLDRAYLEQLWTWLLQGSGVFLARKDPIKWDDEASVQQLSLSEAEAHNKNLLQKPPNKQASPKRPAELRLFASGEQRWLALTGHGPDSKRVPDPCMLLLEIIARRGKEGIIQGELIDESGQDKRSVPARTDLLAERGHIVKKKIHIPKKITSRLIFKRYWVEPETTVDKDTWQWQKFGVLIEHLHAAFKAIKEHKDHEDPRVAWKVLRLSLGGFARNTSGASKAMLDALDRFEHLGCFKIDRPLVQKDPNSTLPRIKTITYIRDVEEGDWAKFWKLGKEITRRYMRGKNDPKDSDDGEEDEEEEGEQTPGEADAYVQEAPTEISEAPGISRPVNTAAGALPTWNPDRTLADLTFRAVQRAGLNGITTSGAVSQVTGKQFTRPLASLIVDISNADWQEHQYTSQHMQIIRDATQMARHTAFTFHTYENFRELVDAGKKSWKAVLMPEPEETGSDQFGFGDLDESLFDDTASCRTLSECLIPALKASQLRYVYPRPRPKPLTLARTGSQIEENGIVSYSFRKNPATKYNNFTTDEEYKRMSPGEAYKAWNSVQTNRRYHKRQVSTRLSEAVQRGQDLDSAAAELERELKIKVHRTGADGPTIQLDLLPKLVAEVRNTFYMPSRAAHVALGPGPLLTKMVIPEWKPLKPLKHGKQRKPTKTRVSQKVAPLSKSYRSRRFQSNIGYCPSIFAHSRPLIRISQDLPVATPGGPKLRGQTAKLAMKALSENNDHQSGTAQNDFSIPTTPGSSEPKKRGLRRGPIRASLDNVDRDEPVEQSPTATAEDSDIENVVVTPRQPTTSKSGRTLKQTPRALGVLSSMSAAALFDLDEDPTPKRPSIGALTYEQQYNWISLEDQPSVNVGPSCTLKRFTKGRGKRSLLVVFRSSKLRDAAQLSMPTPFQATGNIIDILAQDGNTTATEHSTAPSGANTIPGVREVTPTTSASAGSASGTTRQAAKRRRASVTEPSPRKAKKQKSQSSQIGGSESVSSAGGTAVDSDQTLVISRPHGTLSSHVANLAFGILDDDSQSDTALVLPPQTGSGALEPTEAAKIAASGTNTQDASANVNGQPQVGPASAPLASSRGHQVVGNQATIDDTVMEDLTMDSNTPPNLATITDGQPRQGTPAPTVVDTAPNTPVTQRLGPFASPFTPKQKQYKNQKSRTTRKGVQRNKGSIEFERRAALMEFVRQNGGIFPGDNELWFPYCTLVAKSGVAHRPDQRPVKQELEFLIKNGDLKLYVFKFEYTTKHGLLTYPEKRIVAIPGMVTGYDDPKVQDLKKHMIAWHPTKYIPTTVEVDTDLRSDKRDEDRRDRYEHPEKYTEHSHKGRARSLDAEGNSHPTVRRRIAARQSAAHREERESERAKKSLGQPTFVIENYRHQGPINASETDGATQWDSHMRPNKQRLLVRHFKDADWANGDGPVVHFLEANPYTGPEAAKEDRRQRAKALEYGVFLNYANELNSTIQPKPGARMPRRPPQPGLPRTTARRPHFSFANQHIEGPGFDFRKLGRENLSEIGNQVETIQQYFPGSRTFGTFLEVPGWFAPQNLDDVLNHEWPGRPFDRSIEGLNQTERFCRVVDRIEQWETTDMGSTSVAADGFVNLTMDSQVLPSQSRSRLVPVQDYPKQRAKRSQGPRMGPRHLDRIQGLKRPGGKAGFTTVDGPVSKKRKVRGTRHRPQNPAMDKKILLAIIMARILFRSGNSTTTDWDVVQRLLGNELSEVIIRKRFSTMRTPWKAWREATTRDLQWRFLDAYEAGELPPLMYDDIEGTDWVKIMDWVEKQTYQELGSRSRALAATAETPAMTVGPTELAGSRAEVESTFAVKSDINVSKADTFEIRYKGIRLSKRREWLHEDAEVVPARQSLRSDRVDNRTVARSWVRATAVTHNENYQGMVARQKLMTVPDLDIDAAYTELFREKALMLHNKGREHPERTVDISNTFVANFRMNIEIPDYNTSVAFKHQLDAKFSRSSKVGFDESAVVDGDMIAMINLWATKQLNFVPENMQSHKMGMLSKGSYKTRSINKNRLMFSIDVRPTSHYMRGVPAGPAPPHPTGDRQLTAQGIDITPIPVWIDIHDNETLSVWQSSMNVLLYLCMVRPGITPENLSKYVYPTIEAWEIKLLMRWAVAAELADWVGEEQDGIKLKASWWCWLAMKVPGETVER